MHSCVASDLSTSWTPELLLGLRMKRRIMQHGVYMNRVADIKKMFLQELMVRQQRNTARREKIGGAWYQLGCVRFCLRVHSVQ